MNAYEFRTIREVRNTQRLLDAKHRKLRKARELARSARSAKQPEPVQMCAVEDVPAAVSPWIARAGIVAYLLTLAGSALLSVYWASPAVRGFVEMLRAQP